MAAMQMKAAPSVNPARSPTRGKGEITQKPDNMRVFNS